MDRPRFPWVRHGALLVLLLLATAYQTHVSRDVVRDLSQETRLARRPFVLTVLNVQVRADIFEPLPEGAAAGLRPGDVILAVAGRPFTGLALLSRDLAAARPGDTLELLVRRHGTQAEETLRVTLAPQRMSPRALGDWLFTVVVSVVTPWLCLSLGFWVAAVRPRDRRAWLFLALMLSFGLFAGADPYGWDGAARFAGVVYQALQRSTWPIWMLLFGIYFPDRSRSDRRWPWAKWLLIGPLTAWSLCHVILDLANSEDFGLARLVAPVQPLAPLVLVLYMSAIGFFFVSLGAKGGNERDPDARRRLRLLNRGTGLALLPMLLLILASLARWGTDDIGRWPAWLFMPALLMVFLFPLTMAHVIVVERAMDVRVVIRQGLQYALARGGLRLLLGATLLAVMAIVVGMSERTDTSAASKIAFIAAGGGLVMLLQKLGPGLALAVDRRFFRDAYDAETILSELAEEVRTLVETQPLLRRVAERLSAALHVPRVAFLLLQDGCYRPAFALGYDALPEILFPAGALMIARLRRAAEPLFLRAEGAASWLEQQRPDQADERAGLLSLGSELLLPLAARGKLLGVMSLGPKLSEEPYSASDLRLLRSVAAQTGLALENSQLTAAVAREEALRERQRRELEIAREVQEQFFPHDFTPVAGLDYHGACRPARQVGGDYYDFLALSRFGFAIGDVSGKGVPAALLMAGLQASLRAHALQGAADLALLMANVNRFVYECSSPNRYATLFYGQIDLETRLLSYVNAGHNAPILFRGETLIRLETGGPVVGLLAAAAYEQASLPLASGDLLVAFTDGVSESMNAADQEWGERHLVEAVGRCRGAAAAEIVARVMAEADAFATGAPQHDDMTLVVLRVA